MQVIHQSAWRGVRALLMVQAGLTAVMAIIFGGLNGKLAVYSAGLAGLCCILSTAVFALIVFKKRGARAAAKIARSFYRAEAVKWFVTMSLLIGIFTVFPLMPGGAFFVTFCIVQMAYWTAPRLFK